MRRLILSAIALLAAAEAAPAQPRPDGPAGGGRSLYISPAGEPFRGGDGLRAWFTGADADGDGRLTLAEFRADAVRFFKALDKDGDGILRGLELQTYEREIVPEIIGLYGGAPEFGGGRGPGRVGAARFSLLNIPQPVTGADLDGDRRVSLAEFEQTAGIRFDLLDRTKAGVLTLETLAPPDSRRRRR